jgi:hypothetical protein
MCNLTHPSLSLFRNMLGLGEALGFEAGCIWLLCPNTDPSVCTKVPTKPHAYEYLHSRIEKA